MTEKAPPLKIEKLTKYYGDLLAVNEVSFCMQRGEIFGLLGPNGAGKTTIISTITTLEEPSEGRVAVFGHNVTKNPKQAKALIGLVPQELIHYGYFTVEEILVIYSGYFGLWDNSKQIEYVIQKLQLEKHRKKRVKQLSGGMKRRLLIAKALLHKPRLLLLDEPTAGVDMELRLSLWEFLKELRNEGVSILLTTHYLEEAEQLCDRVAFLNQGEIKMIDKTNELVKKLTQREVIFTINEPIPPIKHKHLNCQTDHYLSFELPALEKIGNLIAELPVDVRSIVDIKIREGKLEDAFQRIFNHVH